MRIFAFSDWRSQSMETLLNTVEQLETPVDLIIYAGDDIRRFETGGQNVFAELAGHTRLDTVLAVMGNDDTQLSRTILDAEGVYDLHEAPFVHNDYVFLGLEGAIEGGPGYILNSEAEIRDHLTTQYAGFEDKTPIVVPHVPPRGILDIGQRHGQRHIGSRSVREFIEAEQPLVTVCGHCHQFGGRAETGDWGTVINIASHDGSGAKGRYGILEIEADEFDYALSTTDMGVEHALLQLSQVGGRRANQFSEVGITEFADLCEENRATLLELPGVSDWHVNMWLEEAAAIQNDEVRLRDPDAFSVLADEEIVLLDIETDLAQDRVWLVGLYSYRDGEYTRLFQKDDEAALLQELIEYLDAQGAPPIVYYGNNRFDEECLKRRLRAHELPRGVELLDRGADLGIMVYNDLLGGFNRMSLDALSQYLVDYEYTYPELGGFEVGHQYTKYLLDGEEADWEMLLAYNKDDVLALKAVVDELRTLLD